MQWIFVGIFMKRLKAIRFFMKDKQVPLRKKLIILFGILYLFTPIDLIPEPVLGFGFLDDLALWGFIIYYLKDELDKYWVADDGKEAAKPAVLKGKDIIDDVTFEVEPDIEENMKETATAGNGTAAENPGAAAEKPEPDSK
jgi:uncharacterized membrane protein YkvA (DUF1232 family)